MFQKNRSLIDGLGLRFCKYRLERILKQPGKAVFYLFTIMILSMLKNSNGLGYCNKPCFGPVTKLKIYNSASYGNLYVNGSNVEATGTGDRAIFKISSGRDFYLYDAEAGKFICWINRKKRHRHKSLMAKKYRPKTIPMMRFCKFIDVAIPNGYVNLVPSFDKSLKMRFNKKGSQASRKCNNRNNSRCIDEARFLMQVVENPNASNPCGCPEARRHFCHSELRKMKELDNICKKTSHPSNETYDN